MKIRIDRPTDPELRRQWDEAKRACEQRDFVAELDAMDESLRQTRQEHRAAITAAESRPIGADGKLPLILDDETRPIWEAAQRAAAEVAAWPAWKHTEQPADDDCCVGDRSRCRCAPEHGGWSDEDVEREKWIAVWAGDEP